MLLRVLIVATSTGCLVGESLPAIESAAIPSDVFDTLNAPAAAHDELCANDGMHPNFPNDADRITKAFCQDLVPGGAIPNVQGLADLQQQLGLTFADRASGNGVAGNPGFAILGHSSALTARKVTSITPTAFVFTPPPADGSKPSGYVFLAFDPGEHFVEIAAHDPTVDAVNFYIVLFDQACTAQPGGCTNSQLLTPAITTGWSNVRVYESSTALNNTIADCRQCHIGAGHDDPTTGDPLILRMQENSSPFTHWFSSSTVGGQALLDDFHAAHGTSEDYGPIPAALIDASAPDLMAKTITQSGFGTQPNAFAAGTIETEVKSDEPMQPWVNVPLGKSATWESIYQAGVSGQAIAAPYHDVKVTDAFKLDRATKAYQRWLADSTTELFDLRDIFLDDALPELGFASRANQDGRALLVQMCQQCHNARLDPTLTRDRFLVDQLDQMSRAEKDLAIERLAPDLTSRLRMPPTLFKTINDDDRRKMIAELQK